MKRISTSCNRFQLAMLRDMLQNNHIACVLKNEHLLGAAGELPPLECWPELWVIMDHQYEKARKFVQAYEAPQTIVSDPWPCPACQENLDAAFTQCWQCGYERPIWELIETDPEPEAEG